MIYSWRCNECGAVAEVMRRLDDRADPPTATEAWVAGCTPECVSGHTRVIDAPKRIQINENEDQYWR